MIRAPVTIRNPAARERTWDGRFLVDTGAFDSLVPRPQLEEIGLHPTARRTYELADGSEITMDITVGELVVMGEAVGGTVIFGAADVERSSVLPPWSPQGSRSIPAARV